MTSVTEILQREGKLDDSGLARARSLADTSGDSLHLILGRLGLVGEDDVAAALSESLRIPLVLSADFPGTPILEDRVPSAFLKTCRVLPLSDNGQSVVVAMADPTDVETIRALELQLGRKIEACVGVPYQLDQYFSKSASDSETKPAAPAGNGTDVADIEKLRDLASDAPVIRFVNSMIAAAVADRASDIHIEPDDRTLRIRHRVDGVMRVASEPPLHLHRGIVSRIKVMAGLNIIERRLPQDGRCKTNVQGRPIDIRVSCIPTLHGESVVLRILDKASAPLELDKLGLDRDIRQSLSEIVGKVSGILLVTGPTGSGKTTSLYAALQQINTERHKIITIEDPVEYQIHGLDQMQVKPDIGLGFANILRSVLRHDPDVIMVGEIRDLETATLSIQAALTGHFVLSTLHTQNASGAIARLADMGVEPFLLTTAVRGILAQRLVRALCNNCKSPIDVKGIDLTALGVGHVDAERSFRVYQAVGCPQCSGTGYRGRLCIAELLSVTDDVRKAILDRADLATIEKIARHGGMRPMYADGLRKVLDGQTTVDEILSAVRET